MAKKLNYFFMTKTYREFIVDAIHGKILELLHEKGRVSNVDLVERIHLPAPQILRCTRSLEEQGAFVDTPPQFYLKPSALASWHF